MRGFVLGAASLAILGAAWGQPVGAQEVIQDRETIRACLCQQQALTTLFGAVQERQQNYEASQKTLASLNQELETRRAQIDVYNDAQVDAYKQLLARSDQAAIALADEATPSFNDAVTRYNEALAGYTTQCGGKSFNQTVYRAVQATLSCPKP